MRRSFFVFASVSLAALVCAALASAATTRNAAVKGFQTASEERERIALVLDASGDVSGMLKVSLKHQGTAVTGGSWTLTALPPNADAGSSETGRLTGSVSEGTLTLGEHSIVTSVNSLKLQVASGTGQYAEVNAGSGTVNLAPGDENPSRLQGTLALLF